jgi:glycoprotein endo-alpha-1,2-mannosidase
MIQTQFDRRNLLAGALCTLMWPWRAWAQTRRKEVLAFYYGWYGVAARSGQDIHWQGIDAAGKTIANCPDYPEDGAYDSLDSAVIKRQVQQARDAGITGFVASWWGQKDRTDQQFPLLLDAADGLKIAPYIETATNAEGLAADIAYLIQSYGKHEAWLRLNGKPVIFIFDRVVQSLGRDGWRTARSKITDKAIFVGPANDLVEVNDRRKAFDALHIYSMQFPMAAPHVIDAPSLAAFYTAWVDAQKGLKVTTATVLPGFDDHLIPERTGKRPTVDRANGQLFQTLCRAVLGAKPDWLLVVSFNEWHEASQIEPSVQFGDRELVTLKATSAAFKSA